MKTTDPSFLSGSLPANPTAKVLLLFLLCLPALSARADQSGDFTYLNNGTSVTITGYTGAGGGVDIPGAITNLPVVSIGDYAFQNLTSLTSVTIPNSVLTLGTYAFNTCSGLTNVVIGTNVTAFGDVAFGGCSQLKSVVVPDSVTNLGQAAFEFCPALTSAIIGSQVPSLDWATFYSCTSLTNVVIGAGVTNLGDQAFYNCPSLTGIYFQGNAPGFGANVFQGDNSAIVFYLSGTTNWSNTFDGLAAFELAPFDYATDNGTVTITGYTGTNTAMTIPATLYGLPVVNIGNLAFQSLTNLTSVTIPNGVTNIGDYAFANCASLTGIYFNGNAPGLGYDVFLNDSATVYYLGGATGWGTTFGGLATSAWGPFTYTTNNGAVTITGYAGTNNVVFIPGTISGLPVVGIGPYALNSITFVASITIPDSVTNIDTGAFYACTGLTNVAIGSGVISIGDTAFAQCSRLTSVTIPAGVASIGISAFGYCASLTAILVDPANPAYSSMDGVLFDKSQTTLIQFPEARAGSYAIPAGVTNIGQYAFNSCTSLTNVVLGADVTSIGTYAFANCVFLTSATIGANVTSIGDNAFDVCTSLASIAIPASVTNIGTWAFVDCPNLTNIIVDAANSAYSSANGVLFNKNQTTLVECPGAKAGNYVIPAGVTSIAYGAFYYCTRLTAVTIPASVTNIATYALGACASLGGVYFKGNAPGIGSNVFLGDNSPTVFYLAGTTGWATTYGGVQTVLWNPQIQTADAGFGVRTNRFGFNLTGLNNLLVKVEAATNLANPIWVPLGTYTLTGGSAYFSDPDWTNHPSRFYHLTTP